VGPTADENAAGKRTMIPWSSSPLSRHNRIPTHIFRPLHIQQSRLYWWM